MIYARQSKLPGVFFALVRKLLVCDRCPKIKHECMIMVIPTICQFSYARVVLFSLVLFVLAPLNACEKTPPEYTKFFGLDSDKQEELARKFPIEKQIEYYLAGKRYVHPPESTLLPIISEQGQAAIPALLDRINREDSDSQKVHLLEVFRYMQVFHYDLRRDQKVIDDLRGVVSRMKDLNRKARAEELLTGIAENRKP